MATFQITGPDGKKYRVTGENPAGAMQALKKMMDADANAPKHPAFDGSNIPGYNPETGMVERQVGMLNSAATGAADATTFGFGDELAAGAGYLLDKLPGGGGKDYSQILSEIRGNQQAAQEQNPTSYMAGQVGGAVAQGLASGGAGILSNATTLGGRVLGGAATGATYGGLHGLGSGEGMGDRLKQAGIEGSIGAAVGGAFPLVAAGASKAYGMIKDALVGRQAAQQAGTSPEVLRMLGNVMDADGTRGPTGAANMAKAGQDAMLADAGPNARSILDTAIQRGGPGGVQARQAIADRTARAAGTVTDALDNSLGQPEGLMSARNAIRMGSAGARSSAYDDAYNAAINYAAPEGQALENIIKTRVPSKAIAAANELMRTEGLSSKQILAKVADDGTVVFERLPDVRQIDYITRGLNEVADQADGAGKLGGTTAVGRAYSNLSREIRDTLKGLVPEYGKALETAADPIRRSKAVEFGGKLLSSAVTRDQVDDFAKGITGPEREAIAQGVRSRLDDLMANVTRTIQDGDTGAREAVKAIKDLSSRANREKLTVVLGKTRAEALFNEIDRAATSFDLRASVAENSKTYARLATDKKIGEMTAPGTVATLAQGKPLNAAQRIAQALTGQTPEKVVAKQDAIYSELAKVLTRDAASSRATFQAIDKMGTRDQATKLMADRIARSLLGPQFAYPGTALANNMRQR